FSLTSRRDLLELLSFPTRRSSDLGEELLPPGLVAGLVRLRILDRVRLAGMSLGQLGGGLAPHVALQVARGAPGRHQVAPGTSRQDRKSTRLNSSHDQISYAVFCLK